MARGLWGLSLLLLSSGEGAGGAAAVGAGGNADPAGGGAGTGGGAPAKPATPAAPAGDVEVKGHTVPKHVMDEQKRAAKTAQKAADEYKAAAEAAAAARATAETQLGTLQAQLAFARVGVVDDEHVEAVIAAYGKLPAEGKPASAVEYWQQLQAGTATAPRALLGFMPAAPAAGAAAVTPPAAPARPALPASPASPPPAGATVTVETVAAAQAAFLANKSPENRKRMNDLTAALRAQHAKKP